MFHHKTTISVPPTISREGPVAITILEGDPVTLNCETFGDPTPIVTWKKDDVIMDFTDTGYAVIGTGSLVIDSAVLSDDGIYSCISTNDAGSSFRDFSLTVQCKF